MTTATALDPAEAIRAAIRELHADLRKLVETTDPDDPTLLDKLRKLSTGIGRKITNARKRAEVAAAPELPATQPTAQPDPATTTAAPAATDEKPTTNVATEPAVAAIPAGTTTAGGRVSVRLPVQAGPAATTAPAQLTAPTTVGDTSRRGRHRRLGLPWWAAALALVLTVGGVALALTTGQPTWSLATAATLSSWALVARTGRRARAESHSVLGVGDERVPGTGQPPT